MSLKRLASLFLIIFIISGLGCNVHDTDVCKLHMKNARMYLNAYYVKTGSAFQMQDTAYIHKAFGANDTILVESPDDLLKGAIAEAEYAMSCDKYKKSAVELKISTLILEKQYDAACKFVDSLSSSDFIYAYEKDMSLAILYFYKYKAHSTDSLAAAIKINRAISHTQSYIDSVSGNKFDTAGYAGLFLLKGMILSQETLDQQVDSLKRRFPGDSDIMDGFKHKLPVE